MGVLRPGPAGAFRSNPTPDPHRNPLGTLIAIGFGIIVLVIVVVAGFAALYFFVLPAIGALVVGIPTGLHAGIVALGRSPSWIFSAPPVSAGLLGALSGSVAAWMSRAVGVRERIGRPLFASIFSPDVLETNAAGFALFIAVNSIIGYGIAEAFTSMGAFHSSAITPAAMLAAVSGSGGANGACRELMTCIIAAAALFVTMIVAGTVVAAVLGAALGAAIGAIGSGVAASAAVHGAFESMSYRLFALYAPRNVHANRLRYIVAGAGRGIAEAIVVAMLTSTVLVLARLAHIIR